MSDRNEMSNVMWGGRFQKPPHVAVQALNASIHFDKRLAFVDIAGSIAHARMLFRQGIIAQDDAERIIAGLQAVRAEIERGELTFREDLEDVHMNIEHRLTELIGEAGGRLHTGRSRNDQVALDMHLYLREQVDAIHEEIRVFERVLLDVAEANLDVIIPGYTHLQRAQPVLFAHHLLAYVWMFERDCERLRDARKRIDALPLGAGALAGTTFAIDRAAVAEELGFEHIYENSMDAVSDRDYILETLAALSLFMVHLSRLSEELILWNSTEFGFIELDDAFTTGSSIMPQKKNPDVAELARGKAGRVFGHLTGLLTVCKGLPLAYNKDLQEDKEGVFDALDTVHLLLAVFPAMISTMGVNRERIKRALDGDYSAATDMADYLVRKGLPFRQAHEVVGRIVNVSIRERRALTAWSIEALRKESPLFDEDVLEKLSPEAVVNARRSRGGTARDRVVEQLTLARASVG